MAGGCRHSERVPGARQGVAQAGAGARAVPPPDPRAGPTGARHAQAHDAPHQSGGTRYAREPVTYTRRDGTRRAREGATGATGAPI